MKQIFFLSHANSPWEISGQSDYDRSIDQKGYQEIKSVSAKIISKRLTVEKVFCSPSKRASETSNLIVTDFNCCHRKIEYKDFLYYGSQQDVLNSLARLERSIDSILIVGHNPMIPELIALLTGKMLLNYPTCSLALINTNSWTSLRESKLKFIINSDKLT